jgi:ApbE superfamily uncharacterized protein (UPF0280 family)
MTKKKKKTENKKPAPESYRIRTYRQQVNTAGLISSYVTVRETDLHILADSEVGQQAYDSVYRYRTQLENYLAGNPNFLTALSPLPADPLAPPIIREMLVAGQAAGVGPMAAVAGVIAEYVGKDLLASGVKEVMIENGGDIFLKRQQDCLVSIFAGSSPLSNKVGIKIDAHLMPVGICTSSGAVGHSLSLGSADSVTVLAPSTALADAMATRLGNEVSDAGEINKALALAQRVTGLLGVVIIMNEKLGAWGNVDLVKLS